jgi:hypothetical protein
MPRRTTEGILRGCGHAPNVASTDLSAVHYLVSVATTPRAAISGAIFQAPVSDREAILESIKDDIETRRAYEAALKIASNTPEDKYSKTILPLDVSTPILGPAPLSIARFLSLASPNSPRKPNMDDYFSSDLTDQRLQDTFGKIGSVSHLLPGKDGKKTILMLHGADDDSVPKSIDKEALLARWKEALEGAENAATLSPHTKVIPHANHPIEGNKPGQKVARLVEMRKAVLSYLDDVVGDVTATSWQIWERNRAALAEEDQGVEAIRRGLEESKL